MSVQAEEGAGSLFFELAGNLRLSVLMKLTLKAYRLSQLATELEATLQEAHRNMARLTDSGLVSKNSEGDLVLTPYGKAIMSLIPSYNFLFNNKDYFLEHNLGDLPIQFIQRIGAFQNCEVVHGVMAILQRWKMLYSTSTEYIKEIMTQVPLDLIETLNRKINSGIRFSYIFPTDGVIPKGRRQLLLKFGWRDLISKGLVERRLLDDVKVTTIFNEKQACVLFPDLKGKPDLNVMFYGDHKEFREWCKDFFLYQWMKAGPFDEGKLKPEI